MTLARHLAKRILRGLGPIPAKVRPLLLVELERSVVAAAAVLALADRFDKRNGTVLAIKGAIKSTPPLAEAEWLQLFDLFASGRLEPFHSKPELVRAVLRAGKIEVKPLEKVKPGWLMKRNAERQRARVG